MLARSNVQPHLHQSIDGSRGVGVALIQSVTTLAVEVPHPEFFLPAMSLKRSKSLVFSKLTAPKEKDR